MIDTFVEVKLLDEQNFLKIKETLTRIGIASTKEKKLYQTCMILHKQGKYYIVHFKELFALDGKPTDFSEDDKKRRNTISLLLEDWGLIDIVTDNVLEECSLNQIKILPFKDKKDWTLISKYQIGKKKV